MWKKFMVPIRKIKRIERLLSLRASDGDCGETAEGQRKDRGPVEPARTLGRREVEPERTLVRGVLDTLELDSLKMLCEVMESRGDSLGSCVTVPKNEYVLRSKSATGVLLFCRYFRWPEVDCQIRLRRLFVCQAGTDDCHDCINPYHWSRIYTHESPSPPVSGAKLSSRSVERRLSGESETVIPVSETTGGSYSSYDGSPRSWCQMVYLERRRRVGPQGGWSARGPVQHVFYNLPHEDGVALQGVCGQNTEPEPDVLKTRPHIGAGLTLSMEPSGVWLYNRSRRPLFVSSPTLDPPDGSSAEAVHRLPPDFSVRVFAWDEEQERKRPVNMRDGSRDPYTAVISFAKGWGGADKKRRTVLECPCRLELCFTPPVDRWR